MNSYKRAKRWAFLKQRYETVNIDPECGVYAADLGVPLRCPSCNKVALYGEMYTSLRYHDAAGFGYMVCEHCYEQEQEMRRLLTPKA